MPELINANEFANVGIEVQLDTKIIPIREGEYVGFIHAWEFRNGVNDKQEPWLALSNRWRLEVPQEELIRTGREEIVVNGRFIFLDCTWDTGEPVLKLAKGKNIGLGRLREALGQNTAGVWNFNMLTDAGPVTCKVIHRLDKGEIYETVTAVRKR